MQENAMRGTVHKKNRTLLAVLASILVSAGFFFWSGQLSVVKADRIPNPPVQKPDNSQCLSCHSRPDQTYTFPNGDTISITVDAETYDHAEHSNMACQVCHTNITGFPHPENTAESAREYTLQYTNTCNQCHPDQAKQTMDNAHASLAAEGNPNTPVCASCHDPHAQPKIAKDDNGDPAASEHQAIASTCAKCHSTIVDEYKNSVHGAALFTENNPDVPACDQCHGIHNLNQARTEEFRLNSPQMCAECHTREDIMSKYGISTNVLNSYVDDFHGTTIMLFEKNDPRSASNKAVCYDCHGVHNIASVDDPERSLAIKENMLATCQKCHPDASENFQASWMSHYDASPSRFPLVYYVNLFYKFFIPMVLGGMGLFVLSDILHRTGLSRRKARREGGTPTGGSSTGGSPTGGAKTYSPKEGGPAAGGKDKKE